MFCMLLYVDRLRKVFLCADRKCPYVEMGKAR